MNAADHARETGDPPIAKRVARNTALLFAADIATKLGLFVLYALIARSLGTDGFGDYTIAISLAFFVRASELGIDLILTREVSRDLESVHGLFWDTITLKLAVGVPVLGAAVAFAAAGDYPGSVVAAVALIGASNLIDVVGLSLTAVMKGREDMGPPARSLALESACLVALGSIALFALDGGLVALGVAYVVAALVTLAYVWVALRRRGIRPRRSGERGSLGWLWRVALPTGIGVFFSALLARIDAVILSVMTDDSRIVGLYGGSYRVFEATLFVSWAFGTAVYPVLSRLGRRTPELRRVFEVSCMAIGAVLIPLGAAMALYGPTIVEAVFGSDFADAGTATRILGGATALYGLFTVAALTLVGQDMQRLFPWIGGITLAFNVVLNLILIPPLGLDGAAIAMTASQALMTGLTMWFAIRETGRVSVVRIFAAAAVGVAAMSAAAVVLPVSLAGLVVSLVAYGTCFLAVELLLHRDDLVLFIGALRERVPVDPAR